MSSKAACPPAVYPSYLSDYLHRIYAECNVFRNNVFAYIANTRPAVWPFKVDTPHAGVQS